MFDAADDDAAAMEAESTDVLAECSLNDKQTHKHTPHKTRLTDDQLPHHIRVSQLMFHRVYYAYVKTAVTRHTSLQLTRQLCLLQGSL